MSYVGGRAILEPEGPANQWLGDVATLIRRALDNVEVFGENRAARGARREIPEMSDAATA
jgi:hypothetical protein